MQHELTPQPRPQLTPDERDQLLDELRVTRRELKSSLATSMMLSDRLVELILMIVRQVR